MPSTKRIHIALIVLLVVSALVRGFVAGFIELGNDEVYYWTYARFPALSHFDHPPMVGVVIQLFTWNLSLESEFFLRLAALFFGTLSTLMMFFIGKQIKSPLTGLYAAFLFTASFYGFILSGTFILPDGPQVFFWLVTLYLLVRSLPDPDRSPASRNFLFFAGISTGMALLSKYHAVFLIAGTFFYILFYNRRWFSAKETWGAFTLAILSFLPVIFWNAENDFISFTFHENRVGITQSGIHPQYFLTELVGQFFYNNPVNVILILIAMTAMIRGKNFLERPYRRLILWISLPLLFLFLVFSLFRSTLPHWTGPAYVGLIFIAAAYLAEPPLNARRLRLIPWPLVLSLSLLAMVIVVGVGQIRYGWIRLQKMKVDDVSLDLYGWKQLGEKFGPLAKWEEEHFLVDKGSPLLTFRWFPAANFDYYVARPAGKKVYALGTLERIHKYHWIDQERGSLKKGSDAWYLALSDDYEDPVALYGGWYEMILPTDTISIMRGSDTVRKVFVFRLIDLKETINFKKEETPLKPKTDAPLDTLDYFLRQIRMDTLYLDILHKRSLRDTIPMDVLIRREAEKMVRQSRDLNELPDTAGILMR